MFEKVQTVRPLLYWACCVSLVAVVVISIESVCGCEGRSKFGYNLDSSAAQEIWNAVFTPDSKYIVAGGRDQIYVVDVEHRKLIDRFPREPHKGFEQRFAAVAVSPDSKYVASAAHAPPHGSRTEATRPVRLWDFHSGDLIRSFIADNADIRTLAFSPDSKRLVAGMGMGVGELSMTVEGTYDIWLWSIDGNEQPLRFHGHDGPVIGIIFLPDGKQVVSVSMDCTMRMWDVATQKELKRAGTPRPRFTSGGGGTSWAVSCLAISADGKYLAQGRQVWDVAKWQIVPSTKPPPIRDVEPPLIFPYDCGVLSPDNKQFFVGGGARFDDLCGKLQIYDVATGRQVFTDRVFSNGTPVLTVDVSPDGRYVLAAGSGAITGLDTVPLKAPVLDGNNLYVYRLPFPAVPPQSGTSPADHSSKYETNPK